MTTHPNPADATETTGARRPSATARRGMSFAALAMAAVATLGACSFSTGTDSDEAKADKEPAATADPAPAEDPEPTTTTEEVEPDPVPSTTEEPTEDPSTTGPDAAELDDAQDRVERINLTLEDLPEGWVSEPAIDEVGSVVADCTTSGDDTNVVARARSDRFSLPEGTGGLGLDTASGYLLDEEIAIDLMAELATEDFASCATEQLVSADGVTVVGELVPVSDVPVLADEVVAVQGDFSLSDTSGATAELSALVVAIRTDQVVTTVSATAVDTEGDDQLLTEVLELVAERQEL